MNLSPPTRHGSEIAKSAQITRLPGGGYNRIIGITLPAFSSSSHLEDVTLPIARWAQTTCLPDGGNIRIAVSVFDSQDLILRIPRFDGTNVAAQVGLLRALIPSLPVPEIELYDAGSDNALGQPYVLMRRMSGQRLDNTLSEMTINERCHIAKQVAQLIIKIHDVALPPGIGRLSADDIGKMCITRFPVDPQDYIYHGERVEKAEQGADDKGEFPITTFHAFVSTRIAQLRLHAQQQVPPDTFRLKLLDRFSSASSSLLNAYALPHSSNVVLFHRDFTARNILVIHNTERAGWSITGVLDWDESEAAPLEIASLWPGWLWASDQGGEADFEEDEWDPDLPVPDEKSEYIKQSFVDEIEKLKPGFLEMVRRTRDGCLRLVYERARQGFCSNEHVKDLERLSM